MKKRIVSLFLTIVMMLSICSGLSMPASAATTLNITSPTSVFISKENPPTIQWKAVSGAAGYRITIVDRWTGELFTPARNLWLGTSCSYKLSNIVSSIDGYPDLKVWIGAMATSEVGVDPLAQTVGYFTLADAPDITLGDAKNVTASGATLHMSLDKNNGSAITDTGFYVGTSSSVSRMTKYSFADYGVYSVDEKEAKCMVVSGLLPNTKYYYRAYSENAIDETTSNAGSFTTLAAASTLSLSTSAVSMAWNSTSVKTVAVTCSGAYNCTVAYHVSSANVEGYDYKWLNCERQGNTIRISPLRANYADKARSATITVTCGSTSKTITVTQEACGEAAPSVKVTTFDSPISKQKVLYSGTDLGTLDDTVKYMLNELAAETTNVRKLTVNFRKQGVDDDLDQITNYPDEDWDVTYCGVNTDSYSLTPGEYYVDIWASNSATTNDYWAQKVQTTIYFSIAESHVHNYVHPGYETEHPHKEYLKCECGYAQYTGEERYVSTCSECSQASSAGQGNASAVIALAEKQLGNDKSDYGWTVDWCGYFVGWVGRNAGANFPEENWQCQNGRALAAWFVNNKVGTFYYFRDANYTSLINWETISDAGKKLCVRASRSTFIPEEGDIIIYRWSDAASDINWSHVGFVKSYHAATGVISTIEGNTSGGIVDNKERNFDSQVVGIIRPNYAEEVPLTLSVDSITWGYGAGNETTVNVTCNGTYTCEVVYSPEGLAESGYDYAWLDYEISGSSLLLKPKRINYDRYARTATVYVICGSQKKSITVTQNACGEAAPTVKLYSATSATSSSQYISNSIKLGILDDAKEYKLEHLYAETQNVRKITVNLHNADVQGVLNSWTYYPKTTGATTYFEVSIDPALMKAGEYYVDIWASNSATANDYWAQKIHYTVYFTVEHEEDTEYAKLTETFYEKAAAAVLYEHETYVLKALQYHVGQAAVKAALEAGDNAIFLFDGCSENLNGVTEYTTNTATQAGGYRKNGKTYNTSAVCIVVRYNENKAPYVAFATADASTLPDQVRNLKKRYVEKYKLTDVGCVKDGIYTLQAANYNSAAAISVEKTGNVSAVRANLTGVTKLDGTADEILIHKRYGDDIDWSVVQMSGNKTVGATSIGCFAVGKNSDNSIYNSFMQTTTGKTNAATSMFDGTTAEPYHVKSGDGIGVLILDRICYLDELAVIYGNDAVSAADRKLIVGENIAATLTSSAYGWRSTIMGSDDPAVKQWSRFNSHVAYKDVETIITIPYDANGGTGAPESVTAKAGTRITISDIEPARKGYTFLGWATNSAAITAVYKAGDTYVVQESITFYAVWQKDVFAEGYEFQLIAQTKTSATVSVKNNAGAATAATLILASYNVEGKQVSCQMKEIHLLTGATERITVSFTREDGVSEIRCFLTDADDCVPLYEYWETEI